MTQTFEIPLAIRSGLHARAAARFVRIAAAGDAAVSMSNLATGRDADGRSIIAVLGLGARSGHRLRVTCAGPGERALAGRLRAFLAVDEDQADSA